MKSEKKKTLLIFLILVLLAAAILLIAFAPKIKDKVERYIYRREYRDTVEECAERYSLDASRIYAVIMSESSFDPEAKSSAGAIGLMQIMPSTYEWICDTTDIEYIDGGLTTPEINIECGCWYLRWLYDYFGDWKTVHAAYNAGPGKVKSWMGESGKLETIPNEGVDAYVAKIERIYNKYNELYYGGTEK